MESQQSMELEAPDYVQQNLCPNQKMSGKNLQAYFFEEKCAGYILN